MVYVAIKNRCIHYAKIIFDGLVSKLKLPKKSAKEAADKSLKKIREKSVIYPRVHFVVLRHGLDKHYPEGDLLTHR